MWTLSEAKGLYVEFGFSSRWMMQKSAKGWEETLMRRVLIVGIIYMIKAFTWRFVLDAGKLRNFHNSVRNEATVDVHGCVTPRQRYALFYRVYQRFGIHIGVGFCVARSTELGNAKASQRGTGDGMDSHAFFVYKTKQFINRYIWEATAQMLLYEALLLILFSVGIRTISVHEFFGILYRGNNSRDCLLWWLRRNDRCVVRLCWRMRGCQRRVSWRAYDG